MSQIPVSVDTLKGAPHTTLRYSAVPFGAHPLGCRPIGIIFLLLIVSVIGSLHAQGTEPLRKTDLIRFLTGNTMTLPQVVDRVRRSCVSFTPTARDRQDIVDLGGDTTLLRAIDTCVRNRVVTPAATKAPTARPPVRPVARPAAAPRPDTTPKPAPAPPPPPRLLAVPLSSRVSVPAGGAVNVGVALKRGTEAVSGIRLVLLGSARFTGGDQDADAVTDERGIAQFRFTVGTTTGTTRLAIMALGGDTLDAPAGLEFTVTPAAAPVSAPPPARPQPSGSPSGPDRPTGVPAADHTGFIAGMNQRGAVGETAAQPLAYEVKDGTGRPLSGVGVTFAVTNGALIGTASNLTDSLGHARVRVRYGERAGVPTVVTGTIGDVSHDASLYPGPGAATQLVVLAGGNTLTGEMVVLSGRPTELRVYGRDKFGNVTPLGGLRVASGDERILRVTEVTSDSSGGSITLTAGKGGSTGVVIEGSGLRADFTAQVHP